MIFMPCGNTREWSQPSQELTLSMKPLDKCLRCDSSSHWSLSPSDTAPTASTHNLFPQPSHICPWNLISCSLGCSKARQTEIILVTPKKQCSMISLLICTGYGAHLTFADLILLNKQSEKPHQEKVRSFLPALGAESFQQGWHELAQGKGKKWEEEKGRPPSSIAANWLKHIIPPFVPVSSKEAPNISSEIRGRQPPTSESSRGGC